MPFCRECGTELKADAKFCPNCGTKVISEEAADQETISPEPKVNTVPEPTPVVATAAATPVVTPTVAVKEQAAPVAEKKPEQPPVKAPSQGTQKLQKPADYRNLGVMFLLEFVSVILYSLNLIVKMTEFTNTSKEYAPRSAVAWLLLCFFLPFPCLFIWNYKTGLILDDMVYSKTGKKSTTRVSATVLSVFGLGWISALILQKQINRVVGGGSGVDPESNGIGECSQCGAVFPDTVAECPNCGKHYTRPFTHSSAFPIVVAVVCFVLLIIIIAAIAS